MKKIILFSILATTLPAWAAGVPENTEPELRIKVAEPTLAPKPVLESSNTSSEKVLQVDEAMLLHNPELLQRAMLSAVMTQNIAGIKVLLPIYEKWPKHDPAMIQYARGLQAQAEGNADQAIKLYREFIAQSPDSPMVRWQLARALFEDNQNEAAADQFDRLKSEQLPENVRGQLEAYRQALRERDSWKVNAGFNLTREQNINQAPKQQRIGQQLPEAECRLAQSLNADDDCFRGWKFNAPINAMAINYQFGAEKKKSLKNGWYVLGGVDLYGKLYPNYTQYNDVNTRFSAGIGRANQRNEWGLTPFHERRFYGNHPYTYNNGVRLHWNHWHTQKLQSLNAVEFGYLNNTARPDSNSQSRLLSQTWVFYPNARQYWMGGADVYQERNKADRSESFNRYSLRAGWGQEWKAGFSTRLNMSLAKRNYQGASFLSNGHNRQDKEWATSISLWHRAVHFKGITPRLTFAHQQTWSNDKLYEYGKNRVFIELGKTF